MFPNLACSFSPEPSPATLARNDSVLMEELRAAGIPCKQYLSVINGEVPTRVIAGLCCWSFTRAWRYWVAKGPGLPLEFADQLYRRVGPTCRVDGHGCGPNPREYLHGFACGLYHIDTPEALLEFAETLKDVVLQAGLPVLDGLGQPVPGRTEPRQQPPVESPKAVRPHLQRRAKRCLFFEQAFKDYRENLGMGTTGPDAFITDFLHHLRLQDPNMDFHQILRRCGEWLAIEQREYNDETVKQLIEEARQAGE